MTSRLEGFPNVLLEAQSMGIPIVCIAKGGMGETYIEGKTGISVPQATAKSLADACVKLIGYSIRLQEMSQCACAHADENFSVERMVKNTRDIYKK